MTPQEGPQPRRGRRWIRIALAPLAVAVVLLLAEVAARVTDRVRGKPYSAEATELEMRKVIGLMTASRKQGQKENAEPAEEKQGLLLHPYLGFDWPENAAQVARDSEYYRGAESERNYDVLIVGGSVAGSFATNGSARLEEALEADPLFRDRPVRIDAYGRAAYKEPQQLLLVAYLLDLGFRPDLVLNIDGFNDCALANANIEEHVHPAHPSVSHWAHHASSMRTDRTAQDLLLDMRAKQREATELVDLASSWHLQESALLGGFVSARLRALRKRYVSLAQHYVDYLAATPDVSVSGPPFPADAQAARELVVRTWFESSRSIDALCRARSIHYLHVLQPTLHDTDSKPLTEAEVANATCEKSWIEGVHFGYPRMRELGQELVEAGVHFADCSRLFAAITDKLYFDPCHFNPRGNELLADAIAAAILEHERAPQ